MSRGGGGASENAMNHPQGLPRALLAPVGAAVTGGCCLRAGIVTHATRQDNRWRRPRRS